MIGTKRKFKLDRFGLGQRRDGALRDDALMSLRTLKNRDIVYTDGRLKVRKGYDRFNASALAGVPTQLHRFVDLESNENILAIADSKWYKVSETGAHRIVKDETTTARRPIIDYGNRCIFATDSDVYWVDNTGLGTPVAAYRLGIAKPTSAPTVVAVTGEGNITGGVYPGAGNPGAAWDLNGTTKKKLAAKFQVATAQTIWNINILWLWLDLATHTGEIRIGIYTDDGGEPGELVDPNAISAWEPVKQGTEDQFNEISVSFIKGFDLAAATDYWFVVEGSEQYYSDYHALNFFIAFGYTTVVSGALAYNGSAWNTITSKVMFTIGGIASDDTYFDYVYTYYNSAYGSESRPSEKSERIKRNTFVANAIEVAFTAPTDTQVDQVRIYRREVGTDPDVAESSIADTYKLVGAADDDASPLRDNVSTGNLGGVLQTDNHYLYDDTIPGEDSERPTALMPYTMIEWKGRIVFAEEDGNILYLSKVLEQSGATGLIEDNAPDYFPLENKIEMPVPSGIIGLSKLPDDSLVVFFKNESVWVVWGGNEILNPPPDITYRELLPQNGLFAPAAIGEITGGNVFLGRDGLYRLTSQTYYNEYLSETNQSILDDIENTYLQESIITVNGSEIWLLVDADNDGSLETVMILDLQRDLPTRQLRDRAWRMYEYDVALNDIILRETGGTFRTVLAADAENNYVLELNVGTTDNNRPVVTEEETHDLRAADMAGVDEVEVDAKYIGTATPYEVTVTDHNGQTYEYTIRPVNSNSLRGHRVGCRVFSPVSVRVKLVSSHVLQDELLGIGVGYIGGGD